jgi:IclR family transcriptional regulator, pca regulon regulatory protein
MTVPLHDGQASSYVRGPRYSQSLDKGLAVLRCFTGEHSVLGVYDVASRLGLGRSTTHRLMATLLKLGYLEQLGPGRKYCLSPKAADVGMAAIDALRIRRHSHAALEQLRTQTGFTAGVGVLGGGEALYVDRARASRPGQREIDLGVLGLRVGWWLPAHCCALGKVLLAHLPAPEQRERVKRLKLIRRGPNSITAKTVLYEELERIRTQGFAVSDQELAEALLSIAVPVRDTGTVVAALSIEAHVSMISLEDLVSEFGPRLAVAAERLSMRCADRGAEDTAHGV